MKKITIALLLLFASVFAAGQRDINVTATSPYLVLGRSLIWGNTGSGGVNNNWIFNAIDPNEGLCVYLVNTDAGNTRGATLAIFQTGDPTATSFQNNQSRWSTLTTYGSLGSISASTQAVAAASTQGAARINVQLTGGTGTGATNTADLFIVQTTAFAGCGPQQTRIGNVGGPDPSGGAFSGNPFTIAGLTNTGGTTVTRYRTGQNGGFPQSGSSFGFNTTRNSAIHAVMDDSANLAGTVAIPEGPCGNGVMCDGFVDDNLVHALTLDNNTGFAANSTSANPGAAFDLLFFWNTNGTAKWYQFDRATITCTVACEIKIFKLTANGSTCTAVTPTNTNLMSSGVTALTNVSKACGTPPTTGALIMDLFIQANFPTQVNLQGLVLTGSSGSAGLEFQNVTNIAAGTVTVSAFWGEA